MSGGVAGGLRCPAHGTELMPPTWTARGVPWPDGELRCSKGCSFPIEGGIPRFVRRESYAQAFGAQWRRYRRTQLDSFTGLPISRERLERCLGASVTSLAGRRVLEAGCGAGRFTEILVEQAGELVALDLSDAVDANLENCAHRGRYVLLQADLARAPFEPASFDVVVCLGVVQHTPSPEETIRLLAAHARPGGLLVIDHYRMPRFGTVGQYLTVAAPLRALLKRVEPERGLRITKAITTLCDPIRKRTCRVSALDVVASRLFPTACYYRAYPELPVDVIRQWNELDTHDGLTDWFKHRRSPGQIRAALEACGLVVESCELGGNGVEARARRPRVV